MAARCKYCGKEFGNKGAARSHEPHCPQRPDGGGTAPVEQAEPDVPARRETDGRGVPARPADQPDVLAAVGEAGRKMATLESASPEERARAEGFLFQGLGEFVRGYGERKVKEKLDGIRRAKDHDGAVEKVEEYPTCPDCGYQIRQLPEPGKEFNCNRCGVALVA